MATHKTFADTLELVDGRLRLRPWRSDDASILVEAARESIASVGQWLPWCHANYGPDDAQDWISHCQSDWHSGNMFAFPIFDEGSGILLGSIGLNQLNVEHRSANLGYWVRQASQGSGVATDAIRLVAGFGFEQLGLIRIEIIVQPENLPSRRTAEKSGARFEGMARKRLWMGGQAHHAAVYSLIEADLR